MYAGKGQTTRSALIRSACGAGGELQQVVRFLRQEKEVATVELRLAQHELARLRSDLAVAQRSVLEANAQVWACAGWAFRKAERNEPVSSWRSCLVTWLLRRVCHAGYESSCASLLPMISFDSMARFTVVTGPQV